jgi:hypothetical protein
LGQSAPADSHLTFARLELLGLSGYVFHLLVQSALVIGCLRLTVPVEFIFLILSLQKN